MHHRQSFALRPHRLPVHATNNQPSTSRIAPRFYLLPLCVPSIHATPKPVVCLTRGALHVPPGTKYGSTIEASTLRLRQTISFYFLPLFFRQLAVARVIRSILALPARPLFVSPCFLPQKLSTSSLAQYLPLDKALVSAPCALPCSTSLPSSPFGPWPACISLELELRRPPL